MGNNDIICVHKFYSFFTKYSLMENYGFISGIYSRIFRKIIPEIPEEDTFEFYLRSYSTQNYSTVYKKTVDELLSNPATKATIKNDLDKAITSLSSKIISYGFDHKFQTIFEKLNIDSSFYKKLLHQVSHLSEESIIHKQDLLENLEEICNTIKNLRKNKNIIGTSLHLTVVTRRLLNYINRTKKLIELKYDINSAEKWEQLIIEYIDYNKTKNSLRKFYSEHADLMAIEIVEHTAQKGEKYLAENYKEYIVFFKKGLLGGAFISIFALFKIIIDNYVTSPLPQALVFSINYALCFVIVYFFGGIIATKQPAMTASTIAKHIDKDDDLKFDAFQDIILLLRKIIRSQFISLMGNFLMAFSLSCLIAYILTLGFIRNPIYTEKSIYLINQVFPFSGGAIYYAAIAGVFLSFSGFISGYFDNKVKASNLAYRIEHNNFIPKLLSEKKLKKFTTFIENSLGVHAGNISLGFFLGTAFLLTYIFQFKIDIRHIAFSSSNLGYSIINNSYSLSTISLAIVSVFIIGFVNFIVSFSITFLLVLKSRGIKTKNLGKLIRMSFIDFMSNPFNYLIIRKSK